MLLISRKSILTNILVNFKTWYLREIRGNKVRSNLQEYTLTEIIFIKLNRGIQSQTTLTIFF